MPSEFLRFVAAQNESLGFIRIYYMSKYKFGIKITLLESLRSPKIPLKARFRHNLLKGLSFLHSEFLRIFGALNEFLRLIII